MIKEMKIDGQTLKIEFIVPSEIKKFLKNNNIDIDSVLRNPQWENFILEDLEHYEKISFKKAKLVINYIHITQDKQIRVPPEEFVRGEIIVKGSTLDKRTFFGNFSIGYSIFAQ